MHSVFSLYDKNSPYVVVYSILQPPGVILSPSLRIPSMKQLKRSGESMHPCLTPLTTLNYLISSWSLAILQLSRCHLVILLLCQSLPDPPHSQSPSLPQCWVTLSTPSKCLFQRDNLTSLVWIGCALSSKMVDVGLTLLALRSLNFLKKSPCRWCFRLSFISSITAFNHASQSFPTAFLTARRRLRYSCCLSTSVLHSCHQL